MLYAEIRFAPQLHTKKGLTQEQVVKAALQGLQEAAAGSFFKAKLILCCMRGAGQPGGKSADGAYSRGLLGRGVAALDLAGAEALYPTADYGGGILAGKGGAFGSLYDPCRGGRRAGEYPGGPSYGSQPDRARRAGRGRDPELLEELKEKQIPLEMCPSSNVQTKAVPSLSEHPVLRICGAAFW